MIIETLSTFPDMYASVMGASMMRIAQDKGILHFAAHDLRDWTHDRHRTTDDDPYGGGHGLVMKCGPIFEAYDSLVLADEGTADAAEPSRAGSCGSKPSSRPEGRFVGLSPQSPARDGSSLTLRTTGDVSPAGQPIGLPARAGLSERLAPARPAPAPKPHVVFLAPHGQPFDDAVACELAREERLLFVCGHYEGIDERAYALADRVISLGDYVLTSGELASMVVIDAVVRKLPGVLGAAEGAADESFADGLLEYPQYTRPASFRGMDVPAVLLSGDHGAVARWRREAALERTARLRPDLLEKAGLSPADREFLKSFTQGLDA